ncbi:hypothetical protein L1765_04630 [Microaerobacter geothermalis]|uniref:hypothetical protein n=1 Tax=Microaerobacter geothermalis TaxID=674972 RepID=UPI001F1DADE0|nr:hypothetical protein [Microaerobacter geothermalis]MCF6093282.1 hypothetical protein [Microaerobacter geothermalis]
MDPSWQEVPFIEEAPDVLKGKWNDAKNKMKTLEDDWQKLKVQKGRHEGVLKTEANHLKKIEDDVRKHGRGTDPWEDLDLSIKSVEIQEQLTQSRENLAEYEKLLVEIGDKINSLGQNLNKLDAHGITPMMIVDVSPSFIQEVKQQSERLVEEWIQQHIDWKRKEENHRKEMDRERQELFARLQNQHWDQDLLENVKKTLSELPWHEEGYALEVLNSMLTHAEHELANLQSDKERAENAREMWTDRAAYRVIRIVQALKQMVGSMKITNQAGHSFPLIRIDMKNSQLPERPEEIREILKDYFLQSMDEVLQQYESIEQVPDKVLDEMIGDGKVVLVALRKRYPVLYVYKPQTTNDFLYESPKKHHYTEWETINKGSMKEAKGSGGQLLAARTLVMMMLMTYKRQIGTGNNWTVLISDNPFGQAVSAHILDPIFAIADILRFQWLVLSPPELIKVEVSQRFPVFWELELKQEARGEVLIEQLQHGGRTFEDTLF